MNEPLDAEISAALDQVGFCVRSWRRISTIRAAESGRSVFRVDLEGGRILKARRLENEATARQWFELRQEVPAGFAPVLYRHDAVLLEAWIEGEALGHGAPATAHLIEAATLLARLHGTPSTRGRPLPATQSTTAEREAAEHARSCLAAGGHLRPGENDRVAAALARLDPQRALVGLVHTDFCGENMVIDPDGRLHVIDNERMGVGAFGLDVARTWYRWMLPPAAWECFRVSYRARMPHDDSLRHFAFWALVATLKSAALLSRLDTVRAHAPIECLRKVLPELEPGTMGVGQTERSRG